MTAGATADLPDFLVIGTQKAGTTSLWSYLSRSPEVFFPAKKEPQFFSERWDLGLDWYRALFTDARAGQARGEASTHYSVHQRWPCVPTRIASVCPEVKVVYLLRDPVERARSLYQHRVDVRAESRSVAEVVEAEPEYVEGAAYASQIEAYLEHFPREQILVLSSTDLRERRQQTVDRTLAFLGAAPLAEDISQAEELNTGASKSSYPSWYTRAKRSPALGPVRAVVSKGSKQRLRSVLARAQPPEMAELPPEVEATIRRRLRDDIARLADLIDPAEHPWMSGY